MKNRSFTAFMDKIMDFIGGTMFFMMVLLTGFNVISFWTTGRRFGQLEELVVSCLVWVSYISLGEHYREKDCIRADFLLTALKPKAQKIVEMLTDLAVLIIAGIILFFGVQLMMRSTNKFTGVLKLCYFWIDMGLVFGFLSLVYNVVMKYIPGAKKNEKEGAA